MGRRPFVRQKILEAAFDLIARRGYEAVSTREIAEAASVGPTSMYRHFPSKEELGRALYAIALTPLSQALDAELTTAPDFIGALCRTLYHAYDQRPRALALLIFPPHDFTPAECDPSQPGSIRARLGAALGADTDLAALVWGACTGALQDRFLHQRDSPMGPLADRHATLIRHLLEGAPS